MKFVITIDTEADNQWSIESRLETHNLSFIPRFQALCDRFNFKPTYLCTWEVVHSKDFDRTLGTWQQRGTCEIGSHLHPWSNPPYDRDPIAEAGRKTYPSELSHDVFAQKMLMLSESIRHHTGQSPASYRAGRWGFKAEHVNVLSELGYLCDCSVTPLTTWQQHLGAEKPGEDFRNAPINPYFIDDNDVCRAGASSLLEVPVTIMRTHPLSNWPGMHRLDNHRVARAMAKRLRLWRNAEWFRPWPYTDSSDLVRVYECAKHQGLPLVEMMFHSSELMPGGSPFWPDEAAVENLYETLEQIFSHAFNDEAEGVTLRQFSEPIVANRIKLPSASPQVA